MILSSVNFIKSSRNAAPSQHFDFSDFILGKIKEDQEKKDKRQHDANRSTCYEENKISKNGQKKDRHQIYRATSNSSDKSQGCKKVEVCNVTLETKDGYVVNIDTKQNRLFLGDEEDANTTNIFRQKSFHVEEDGKCVHLCSFQLHSDSTSYISVSEDRKLQVLKTEGDVDPSNPDSRLFVIHKVSSGSVFLQPYAHKGYYIHHMDDQFCVRKLEINWRPPEEYFFNIGIVDLPEPEVRLSASDVCENANELKTEEKYIIKKEKTESPSLFFGCFGGKSKLLSKKFRQSFKQKPKQIS